MVCWLCYLWHWPLVLPDLVWNTGGIQPWCPCHRLPWSIYMCMSHGLQALNQASSFAGPGGGESMESVLFLVSIPSRLVCGSIRLTSLFRYHLVMVWLETIGNLRIPFNLILGELSGALWILILTTPLWVLLSCLASHLRWHLRLFFN